MPFSPELWHSLLPPLPPRNAIPLNTLIQDQVCLWKINTDYHLGPYSRASSRGLILACLSAAVSFTVGYYISQDIDYISTPGGNIVSRVRNKHQHCYKADNTLVHFLILLAIYSTIERLPDSTESSIGAYSASSHFSPRSDRSRLLAVLACCTRKANGTHLYIALPSYHLNGC